jgi:hypothetical protein
MSRYSVSPPPARRNAEVRKTNVLTRPLDFDSFQDTSASTDSNRRPRRLLENFPRLFFAGRQSQETRSMLGRILFSLGIAASIATPALAQKACPLSYKIFEFAVPHLDLEQCPKDLARAGVFCRVSTANDAVHVFAFEDKGEQCLVAVKSYNEYQISVK